MPHNVHMLVSRDSACAYNDAGFARAEARAYNILAGLRATTKSWVAGIPVGSS